MKKRIYLLTSDELILPRGCFSKRLFSNSIIISLILALLILTFISCSQKPTEGIVLTIQPDYELIKDMGMNRESTQEQIIAVLDQRLKSLGVFYYEVLKKGENIEVKIGGKFDSTAIDPISLVGQTGLLEFKLLENYDNALLLFSKIDSIIASYKKEENVNNEKNLSDKKQTKDENELLNELMADTSDYDYSIIDEKGFDPKAPFSSLLKPSLYNNSTNQDWPGFQVEINYKETIDEWLSLPDVRKITPVDVQFCWSQRPEMRNGEEVYLLYLLKRRVQFLGKFLKDIEADKDSYGSNVIQFKLEGEGSTRFSRLTGTNIDKPLAILFDNEVISAPFINGKIRGRGQISMGSGATFEDARQLEIILRSGTLPVPISVIDYKISEMEFEDKINFNK